MNIFPILVKPNNCFFKPIAAHHNRTKGWLRIHQILTAIYLNDFRKAISLLLMNSSIPTMTWSIRQRWSCSNPLK